MTNPKVTLVPITQHFDADGKPSCDFCGDAHEVACTNCNAHICPGCTLDCDDGEPLCNNCWRPQ